MKALHRLVVFLLFMLLLGVALALLGAARSAEEWEAAAALAQRSRLPAVCAGAGLLCLAALFLFSGLSALKHERFLSFESEGGAVRISTKAIADYLLKLSDEFPSIIRMTPRVVPGRNSIDIAVDVRIKADPRIPEICETFQKRVRDSMAMGLGISCVRQIQVIVKEIRPEHRPE